MNLFKEDIKIEQCRCCLDNSQSRMKNLFEFWKNNITFGDLLEDVIGLKENIDVACFICDFCEMDLIDAYTFKRKCWMSQEKILNIKKISSNRAKVNICEKKISTLNEDKEKLDTKLLIFDDNINLDIRYALDNDDVGNVIEIIDNKDESRSTDDIELDDDCEIRLTDEKYSENQFSMIKVESSKPTLNDNANCLKCLLNFNSREEYFEHYRVAHSGKNGQRCGKCDVIFPSRAEYANHYKLVHRDTLSSKCSKCNLEFKTANEYHAHYRKVHRDKVLCPQCGGFYLRKSLIAHMESHNEKKEHICKECGKQYMRLDALKAHMRCHTNELRYTCKFCGKKFLHWNSRRGHIMVYHTERGYKCSICGKGFLSNYARKIHETIHTQEKQQVCEFCNKRFATHYRLKTHMKVHERNEHFTCEICLKVCSRKQALQTHMKTHGYLRQ